MAWSQLGTHCPVFRFFWTCKSRELTTWIRTVTLGEERNEKDRKMAGKPCTFSLGPAESAHPNFIIYIILFVFLSKKNILIKI